MAEDKFSHLQRERLRYEPPLPRVLAGNYRATNGDVLKPATDGDALQKLFPQTYGKALVSIEAVESSAPVRASSGGATALPAVNDRRAAVHAQWAKTSIGNILASPQLRPPPLPLTLHRIRSALRSRWAVSSLVARRRVATTSSPACLTR